MATPKKNDLARLLALSKPMAAFSLALEQLLAEESPEDDKQREPTEADGTGADAAGASAYKAEAVEMGGLGVPVNIFGSAD